MFDQDHNPVVSIIAAIAGFIVKYIAYSFLSPVILMTLAALIFAQIVLVGPEIPFYEYFSDLIPARIEAENIHIDETDILTAYNWLTLALFLLSLVAGWLVRAIKGASRLVFQPVEEVQAAPEVVSAGRSWLIMFRRRLLAGSLVITAVYLIAFIAIPSASMSDGSSPLGVFLVFIVFYVLAMVLNAIYVALDSLSDQVIGWAWSKRLVQVYEGLS